MDFDGSLYVNMYKYATTAKINMADADNRYNTGREFKSVTIRSKSGGFDAITSTPQTTG
jgi:hypothetical protein